MSDSVDDPVAQAKKDLDLLMRAPPFSSISPKYIGIEWQCCVVVSNVAYGKDQKYSGFSLDSEPHGWGVLEHHVGLTHSCGSWKHGIADGSGMLTTTTPPTALYGTWANGVRVGFFVLCKEGAMFIEEYSASGELLRRIKWRRDKLHKKCDRCLTLFIPSANTPDCSLCRFHPEHPDHNGTYACCGAMKVYNPRGCALTTHTSDTD